MIVILTIFTKFIIFVKLFTELTQFTQLLCAGDSLSMWPRHLQRSQFAAPGDAGGGCRPDHRHRRGHQGDEQRAKGARTRGSFWSCRAPFLLPVCLIWGQDLLCLAFDIASHTQTGLKAWVLVISPNTESSSPHSSVLFFSQVGVRPTINREDRKAGKKWC